MLNLQNESKPLPSALKNRFRDLILLTEEKKISSSNYLLYKATSADDDQTYTLRLLNLNSELYKKNRNQAVSLFLQEIFYLCAHFGSFQRTESGTRRDCAIDFKKFAVEGERIAFVMQESYSLKHLLDENRVQLSNIEIMFKEVYDSIKYINSVFGISNINLTPESIYSVAHTDSKEDARNYFTGFYIADWITGGLDTLEFGVRESIEPSNEEIVKMILPTSTNKVQKYASPELLLGSGRTTDCAAEIYNLGLVALELAGIDNKVWKLLPFQEDQVIYDTVVGKIIQFLTQQEGSKEDSKSNLGELIRAMLEKLPSTRIKETEKKLEMISKSFSTRESSSVIRQSLSSINSKTEEEKEYSAVFQEKPNIQILYLQNSERSL